ncbi:MAG: hypothetical protein K0Q49_1186 [Haloplasmataceae bacterium]|nr:hypothetical protein [Haloplasmataceae bacterium]
MNSKEQQFIGIENFDIVNCDQTINTPEKSTFFSTVFIEDKASYDTLSDGDLWPSAWSDDDHLYVGNGDGKGFNLDENWEDIVINKLSGSIEKHNLSGEKIMSTTPISQVWGDQFVYNRKPTGMVSVEGRLYLAVQDLNKKSPGTFDDAPNATIIKSDDKGKSWSWDQTKPMFSNHFYTTIMFLDYGKDYENNTFDDYVYAYGLDYNWRDSFSDTVTDPQHVYLARMPKDGIQNLSKWEFYTGDLKANASWSSDIQSKKPVLTDQRRIYNDTFVQAVNNMSVISQSSIVYNKAINRYIYSSWTEYTFEFYESPTPWGPWRHFYTKDFGAYPWNEEKYGGYATVIPSKFISEDGLTMWVNSNTFVGGIKKYNLSFRKLKVSLYTNTKAMNGHSEYNLAMLNDTTPISLATHYGIGNKLNDGNYQIYDDSYNGEKKVYDYWGLTWTTNYNMNEINYYVGDVTEHGGWFKKMKVQVRQNNEWIDTENTKISYPYTFDQNLKSFSKITIKFKNTFGDGVRIIGIPGGDHYYTSISELEVFYK